MKFVVADKQKVLMNKEANKNKRWLLASKTIESFLNSNFDFVMVMDEQKHYHNNNDLRQALFHCIKRHNYQGVKVMIVDGEVYLEKVKTLTEILEES